ncbi:MAG: M23 family metallopeptidase [Bacteroidetes bacterium]|nr:M23 family metallopeptidase [Bacteroidota bacterium]MBS1541695.1 M23 family metallopeptidase [Bacteroidota bacterium]
MKLSKLLLLGCTVVAHAALSQLSPDKTLPSPKVVISEPYLFPINPGSQNALTGTMGELRSTHLHTGIDIRTNNMTGLPVRATQRGYINRVIVGTYGYGHAIFIKHPDGNESVYGHLDRFNGKLGQFILKKQYEKKSFDIDLELKPDQFPINKGDTIAFSGNTGGSAGPHLHFEIRDNDNHALNPLDFKFTEINDVLAPVIQKIALRTMNEGARINHQFGRKEYVPYKNGNDYYLAQPVLATGKIGIELLAYDRTDFSGFRCGINEIEIRIDSQRVFIQKIDKVSFEKNRQIASIVDYEVLKTRGVRFNKLYREDGNQMTFYQPLTDHGFVYVTDKKRQVEIRLTDSYGNTSRLHLTLEPQGEEKNTTTFHSLLSTRQSVEENILKLTVPCGQREITFFEKGTAQQKNPTYVRGGEAVYLLNMFNSIPDSAQTCGGMIRFNVQDAIPSGIRYTYYSDWAILRFTPESLYDTLYLEQSKRVVNEQTIYSLGNALNPLRTEINVTLKPSDEKSSSRLSVYRNTGRYYEYLGGRWDNGAIQFKTKELGDFVLMADSVAPLVHRIRCNSQSAWFRIMDNLSGIDSFQATINGEWLLMKYDYKTGILQSEKLDNSKLLQGDFELKVTDRSGNERVYRQRIL